MIGLIVNWPEHLHNKSVSEWYVTYRMKFLTEFILPPFRMRTLWYKHKISLTSQSSYQGKISVTWWVWVSIFILSRNRFPYKYLTSSAWTTQAEWPCCYQTTTLFPGMLNHHWHVKCLKSNHNRVFTTMQSDKFRNNAQKLPTYPQCLPITSNTKHLWWLAAVVLMASTASIILCRAVSVPIVMSVPQKSLSIEPTIPTIFKCACVTFCFTVMSPKIVFSVYHAYSQVMLGTEYFCVESTITIICIDQGIILSNQRKVNLNFNYNCYAMWIYITDIYNIENMAAEEVIQLCLQGERNLGL